MPTIDIQLTAGQLPPNPCYTSEQARFNAYVAAIQSSLPVNFTTVIVSQSSPGPDDRDKVWIKVDGSGRILGTFLFSNGTWQSVFPTNPYIMPGEYREYDPSLYTPAQSVDEPWFPCDGTVTGVQNRKGAFLVGAGQRTLPTGSTDTATNFVAGTTGGRETLVLTDTNLPAHTHTLKGVGSYGTTTSDSAANLPRSNGTFNAGWIAGGNTTGTDANNVPLPPVPASTLPPYIPTYWMQWRPDLV